MSRARERSVGRLSYTDVEARLGEAGTKVALLPTGSTEAHGPHLSLATDSVISTTMAEVGARKLEAAGYVALVLPAVNYAVTEWARSFPGSVSLRPETAAAVLTDIIEGCLEMGFDHVVMCNAHLEPDNIGVLRTLTKHFAERHGGGKLLFPDNTRRGPAQRLGEEFKSGSCHAGQYETSLVLAVDPSLAQMDRAEELPNLFVPFPEKIRAGAKNFADCGMDRAYCGDPAQGTAAEGESLYDTLGDLVFEAVDAARNPAS